MVTKKAKDRSPDAEDSKELSTVERYRRAAKLVIERNRKALESLKDK